MKGQRLATQAYMYFKYRRWVLFSTYLRTLALANHKEIIAFDETRKTVCSTSLLPTSAVISCPVVFLLSFAATPLACKLSEISGSKLDRLYSLANYVHTKKKRVSKD